MKLFSKKNIQANACSITLLALIILGVLYILYTRREGMLSSGLFPQSVEGGLLAPPNGAYNMYPKGACTPGLSNATYQTEWKLYPYTEQSSYAQVTNNKRYWSSPCNGTSAPAEICGGLYQKKKVVIPPLPKMPPLSPPNGVRVNYYVSDA